MQANAALLLSSSSSFPLDALLLLSTENPTHARLSLSLSLSIVRESRRQASLRHQLTLPK